MKVLMGQRKNQCTGKALVYISTMRAHEETWGKVAPKGKEEHHRTQQLEPHQEDMVTPPYNKRPRDM
jgi:hypothetical protein